MLAVNRSRPDYEIVEADDPFDTTQSYLAMNPLMIVVPEQLDVASALQFARELRDLPEHERFDFDFCKLGRVEPFGMLIAATAISECRERFSASRFTGSNFKQHTYAAHMGFFTSFGLNYGNKPGEAPGGGTYIPITEISISKARRSAAAKGAALGEVMEEDGARLAAVLCRNHHGPLEEALTYAIREILRNALEHSEGETVRYCGQYWPSSGDVEIAVADNGQGIRRALAANPHIRLSSDEDAIAQSLLPGISGKAFRGSRRSSDPWANSGYGLYMTNRLCGEGGAFTICSGTSALLVSGDGREQLRAAVTGTALRMVLNQTAIGDLSSALRRFRDEGFELARQIGGKGAIQTSAASTSLFRRRPE